MAVDPITAGFNFGRDVVSVISEAVEDKDLKVEIAFRMAELSNNFQLEVLKSTTTPKVDALVKLIYATRDVIIPMLRPLGGAIITTMGLYMTHKGMLSPGGEVSVETITGALATTAFPAWGLSRHINKNKEQVEQTKRKQIDALRIPKEDEIFTH